MQKYFLFLTLFLRFCKNNLFPVLVPLVYSDNTIAVLSSVKAELWSTFDSNSTLDDSKTATHLCLILKFLIKVWFLRFLRRRMVLQVFHIWILKFVIVLKYNPNSYKLQILFFLEYKFCKKCLSATFPSIWLLILYSSTSQWISAVTLDQIKAVNSPAQSYDL